MFLLFLLGDFLFDLLLFELLLDLFLVLFWLDFLQKLSILFFGLFLCQQLLINVSDRLLLLDPVLGLFLFLIVLEVEFVLLLKIYLFLSVLLVLIHLFYYIISTIILFFVFDFYTFLFLTLIRYRFVLICYLCIWKVKMEMLSNVEFYSWFFNLRRRSVHITVFGFVLFKVHSSSHLIDIWVCI